MLEIRYACSLDLVLYVIVWLEQYDCACWSAASDIREFGIYQKHKNEVKELNYFST